MIYKFTFLILTIFAFLFLTHKLFSAAEDWNARDYSKYSSNQYNSAQTIVNELLKFSGNEKVLDVGCGTGKTTHFLSTLIPRGSILGIDKSKGMIKEAQQYANAHLTFKELDACEMSWNKEFDTVTSFFCIHWIKNQATAINNIFQALKDGGKALIVINYQTHHNPMMNSIDKIKDTKKWKEYFKDFIPPWHLPNKDAFTNLIKQHASIKKEIAHQTSITFKSASEYRNYLRCAPLTNHLPENLKDDFISDLIKLHERDYPNEKKNQFAADVLIVLAEKSSWNAPQYKESSSNQHKAGIDSIKKFLTFKENEKILDVGCGTGLTTKFLATHVPQGSVLGIDKSIGMIEQAQEHSTENLSFQHLDACDMNWKERFDVITSVLCIHWIQDQEKAIENICRALKPNGKALLILSYDCPNPLIDSVVKTKETEKWSPYFLNFELPWNLPRQENFAKIISKQPSIVIDTEICQQTIMTFDSSQKFHDFIRCTPVPAHLPENLKDQFVQDILHTYENDYPHEPVNQFRANLLIIRANKK